MTGFREGRFITLEGGEGSGKSTQIALVAAYLRENGLDVVETREPGGAPGAEKIRDLLVNGPTERWEPITETLLHFAARREHIERRVRPALERGAWVVCDRFVDSTMAYQGYGLGVSRDIIDQLSHIVLGSMTPDLTFILDIPPEIGLKRAEERRAGETRYERMETEFHARLRNGFLEIALQDTGRYVVLDATAPIETLFDQIRREIDARLMKGQP